MLQERNVVYGLPVVHRLRRYEEDGETNRNAGLVHRLDAPTGLFAGWGPTI